MKRKVFWWKSDIEAEYWPTISLKDFYGSGESPEVISMIIKNLQEHHSSDIIACLVES